MRLRRLACLAAVGSLALTVQLPGPAVAEATTIYVNNDSAAHCSDSGAGTQSQPYCTLQSAADAVQPGQTVQVAPGGYSGYGLRISHSGTPDKPIVFQGSTLSPGSSDLARIDADRLTLDGVQDVRIAGFQISAYLGVVVNGTTRVTLDRNDLTVSTVEVGGTAKTTTISRNRSSVNTDSYAVTVDAGATGTVVSTNALVNQTGGGLQVTDAPGTVVTGNTVNTGCAVAVGLFGASANSVVENNVLAADGNQRQSQPSCATLSTELAVSTASAPGTKADYNLTFPPKGEPSYLWAGRAYATAGAFAQGVPGQAAHELTADPLAQQWVNTPSEGSPVIDSADAAAPGEVDTDVLGYHRVNDPLVADTGTGNGSHDRGAYEVTPADQRLGLQATPNAVPAGETSSLSIAGGALKGWGSQVSYHYVFGDGGSTDTSEESASHTYATIGNYTASVSLRMSNGDSSGEGDTSVYVTQLRPLNPYLSVTPGDHGLVYSAQAGGDTPWTVTDAAIDFGDGTPGCQHWCDHAFHQEGDYTVTARIRDAGGRSGTVQQQLHVSYQPAAYRPLTPTRVLDTRLDHTTLHAGGTLSLQLPGIYTGPGQAPKMPPTYTAEAAVLNVTAVSRTASGYLTVYPGKTDRPTTSNVNFTTGQAVPNLVTVPIGADGTVQVYNAFGDTDVVVDLEGLYTPHLELGKRFTAEAPARLLDTRPSDSLGPGGETSIPIRGRNGVPSDATAVVLNVTATQPDAAGYFTVYPSGGTRPGTSNLNFTVGQTVANQVIVPIGGDGSVRLYNFTGHAHAVVDLFGYYGPGGESLLQPTTPRRLLDTRIAATRRSLALGPGATTTVATGAPAGSTGAVLNVTATAPTTPGYLTVWAAGQPRPGTSNLNFLAGQTVPNHVTTPLDSSGAFEIYNFNGSTQVVADLFGYFLK
ncbi:hypothetical protein CFP65_1331 [Kitasatospora sp. MMS16-BH015]|uniref:PKD domain-containing protein n=1 Tax=Kitasatospora sp. MMS16-BH015 TaxID=2018025 RepID=UPI000CA3C10C|nr:PKD domain-containing protein [Kitasatospora sp. MMS16-BH015]AUG76230.1 hypothetical protein CFP65_1331 [Kitasatospora sp. MMS16-BH015]